MTEIALITGGNKGIGFETARQLGAAGVRVLVGARAAERGEPAAATLRVDGADATFVRLDVTDEDAIEAAAKRIEAEFGRLDILVNNAGISVYVGSGADGVAPPSRTPVAAVRENFETNVFGVIAVTNVMLPLLRKAPLGRIVNVSSGLGSVTLAAADDPLLAGINLLPYNTSKTALNGVTIAYARELRDTPIKVNAVTPGYCATDLNGHTGFRTAAEGAEVTVRLALIGPDGPTGGFFGADGPVPW
ncbi:MAG TPA: SDR family oxidoreductase [Streptosporangiaceae bacterium]|jgi:NAD(P)-dependent dehydrogenase (short-subunit alcohol dehydrogenase family)